MPRYRVLPLESDQLGLNTLDPEDALQPGQLRVCDNVETDRRSLKKSKGFRNVALGTVDAVHKGGPPGASLKVTGNPWWLEHNLVEAVRFSRSGLLNASLNFFRSPLHARHGLIVAPEGAQTVMRLNTVGGSATSIIAFPIWSDDFQPRRRDPSDLQEPFIPTVVLWKGWHVNTEQWRIVIKTDQTDMTTDPVFYISLELQDSGTFRSFQYESGGSPASFFEPGRRHWVAWKIDPTAVTVTSYYWKEGDSTAASFSASYAATTLDTVGNVNAGNTGCPLVIGAQKQMLGGATGFNGVVGDMLFWDGSIGNGAPTFNSSYPYYETEIPDSELTGAAGTISGDTDLALYYRFRESSVTDTRFVLPAYTTATAADNRAWLTGADASWSTNSGTRMGARSLSFVPSGPSQTNQPPGLYRGLVNYDTLTNGAPADAAQELFCSGLRIPGGWKYVKKLGTGSSGFESLDDQTLLVYFTISDTDATITHPRILFELCSVLQGTTATDEAQYLAQIILSLAVVNSGGGWKVRASYNPAGGGLRTATGTTNLVAGTEYCVAFSLAWGNDGAGNSAIGRIYLNGVLEATDTAPSGSSKQAMSEATGSVANGSNTNDDDGRTACFPMAIGCDIRVTTTGTSPAFRNVMFGAWETIGYPNDHTAAGKIPRRWWAFHTDDSKKDPDDGVIYRGFYAHRGTIGGVLFFAKTLSTQEITRFSSAIPSDSELRSYGDQLLSAWTMEEGSGNIVYDKGSLGNHLALHPYPMVRPVATAVARREKSPILMFHESRTRTPREGVNGREIYAVTSGSMLRLVDDGTGKKTWELIASNLFAMDGSRLGSFFQFSDFLYLATGHGPVMRLSRNKVTSAGLAGPFSRSQNDNLGWQEGDRDGTFEIQEGGAGSVFLTGERRIYQVTFYDPDSGTESTPSRQVYWTNTADTASLILNLLPRPHDRHATRYRIYRSSTGGGVPLFLDEIPIQPYYVDDKPDADLSAVEIDSLQNYPPPRNASVGIRFGGRALYAGVPEQPGTIFASKEGFPEHCPIEYQITVTSGKSSEITGLVSFQGRAIVFLQDTTFLLTDSGGDVGQNSLTISPFSFENVSDAVGCVGHQTIEVIDGVGVVFVSERGIQVTGDGINYPYVSRLIEPTFDSLDKSTWRKWHAVHLRRRNSYYLFCSDGTTPGENNRVICWDYAKNTFRTKSRIFARFAEVVEDEATGVDRLYFTDYLGQLWELDPPDEDLNDYGAGRTGFTTTTGTVQSDAGNSTLQVKLVADGSLPTAGDGLRGVELTIGTNRARIARNDTNIVYLETDLASAPVTNDAWKLGSIPAVWQTGQMDMGNSTRLKQVHFLEANLVAASGSQTDWTVTMDDSAAQSFLDRDMGVNDNRFGPILGRGRRVKIRCEDDAPSNPWEVQSTVVAWRPKGRASW